MKCMYTQTRPQFILSSGVFWGMEFEPMLTPREKSPLPKMSPEEDRTRDAVDSEPKHYQLNYSGPPVQEVLQSMLMKLCKCQQTRRWPGKVKRSQQQGCHWTFAKITENLHVRAVSQKMNTKRDRKFRKRKMK